MDKKMICKRLRHEFSTSGWILLLQYGIMNFSVMLVCFIDGLLYLVRMILAGQDDPDAFLDYILTSMLTNGWGYVLAVAIGALVLLLWKKKDFCLKTIWQRNEKMTPGAFFSLLALFFGVQALTQTFAVGMEWLFNQFGMSLLDSMEVATATGDTFSMFLYAAVLGPIWEELLFRGGILRSLQPYGKKFAILGSAFLFGIFHGNIIQTPFAFGVGLILGYVTVEYSVFWAIVLHLLNNLVLADLMGRLALLLPAGVGDLITLAVIWGCLIAGVVILIVKRRQIREYVCRKRMHPWCVGSFFSSPGVIVLTVIMAGNILLPLILSLTP